MKVVRVAVFSGSYGKERATVSLHTSGRFKGYYAKRVCAFAGRIAYPTVEAASAQMQHHACFLRWEPFEHHRSHEQQQIAGVEFSTEST